MLCPFLKNSKENNCGSTKKRNIEIVKLEDVNVNLREMYLSNQRYVVKYDVYPSDAEDLDLEFIALDKNIKVEKTDKME